LRPTSKYPNRRRQTAQIDGEEQRRRNGNELHSGQQMHGVTDDDQQPGRRDGHLKDRPRP
jgi:hypothetical protein